MNKKEFKKNKFWRKISYFLILCLTPLVFVLVKANNYTPPALTTTQYQASEQNGSSDGDSDLEVIAYPQVIKFALASLDAMIPDNPPNIPDRFEKFYFKLLNYNDWISISRNQTDTYTSSLIKLYNYYFTKARTPSYVGNFPIDAQFLLTNLEKARANENILGQFKLINGIPPSPETTQGVQFKYIVPKVINVLDDKFGTSSPTIFPTLNNFDYKMVSIDTSLIQENNPSYLELEYKYNGLKKYRIFIRNKDNLFNQDTITLQELIANGNILIRQVNKKYEDGDLPINLENINLSISKIGNELAFYTSIKLGTDFSTLKVNVFPSNWESSTKIGLLESSLSPLNVIEAINIGASYRLVPTAAINKLRAYSEKSEYKITQALSPGSAEKKQTFSISFYMAPNEKINIPIFYRNKAISGASIISIETDAKGVLKTKTPTLKIPNDEFVSSIEPIKIKHRKIISPVSKRIWTEVAIITDENVLVGSKDFRSTTKKLIPGQFDLKLYDSANHRSIIFENPAPFSGDYSEIAINYTRIFDSINETSKLIGEAYYSAWGIYETPRFNVPGLANEIRIENLALPSFQNNSLSYKKFALRAFGPEKRPTNQKIVGNNFGKMIEDINDYSNRLGKIIKDITKKDLHDGYEINYLKPSIRVQEQKFVNSILLPDIINQKIELAFQEVQFATEAFINGQSTLNDEQTRKERELPDISMPQGIEKVLKGNRQSWIDFAMPRILIITKNRYYTLFSQFEGAIFDYKYKMVTKLLDASDLDYKKGFLGINEAATKKETMQIGLKKQEMIIISKVEKSTRKFKKFKNKLQTIINEALKSQVVNQILDNKDALKFEQQTQLLIADKKTRDNNQRPVFEAIKWIFKIVDFYVPQQKSLLEILNLSHFIKDDQKRLAKIVGTFNDAVLEIVKIRDITVVAYAFKATISSQKIDVAIHNLKKIFDSFLAQKLSLKEVVIVQKWKDYNYKSDPNKIAELAVKIGEYNLERFFDNITHKNIGLTAKRVLRLDPLKELPFNLPPKSKFADVIEKVSQKTNIIFISIGVGTFALSILISAIGYRNRKILTIGNKILIICSLVALTLVTISIGIALPVAALPIAT